MSGKEDDLYSGLAGADGRTTAAFGGGGPMNPIRGPGTAIGGRATGRIGTAAGAGGDGPRPMTSVKGAGFQSRPAGGALGKVVNALDAVAARTGGPAPPLADNADNSPEEAAKGMELKVHQQIEACAKAAAAGDVVMALERAKEAGRKERQLVKFKDSNNMADNINMDLTYCCAFNLAQAYHQNKMYAEALNTYSLIVKNKQYPQAGRLRVNMGAIYYEERKYPQAIKMFRMALDQVPPTNKELVLKIQRNIGHAFVRQGQFQDAIAAFEGVMDVIPEIQAGFNLLLCYYALGDVDLMKKGFLRLLAVPLPQNDDPEEGEDDSRADEEVDEVAAAAKLELVRDPLTEELEARQRAALEHVTTAAKLIAPAVDPDNWVAGYDWVIDQLRRDHPSVASELLICRALEHMGHKHFDRAIEELKAFEKKEVRLRARAATNLSFLYFLEGDMGQASKHASLAVKHDRYNAKALVNMGNVLLERGEAERAKELYLEAIGVEADCVEAIFNLGLVNKQLGVAHEALQAFEKLHSLAPAAPEVIFQIATLHEAAGNLKAAAKYFNLLLAKVPSDPGVLNRLGAIFAKDEDETQAFHYHHESYRFFPVNLEVISWLGVWYVKSEMYEKAVEFFERASEIQPAEVKWKLMVASCHRRMTNYARALECYEAIHAQHPDDAECLRFLIALCKDFGRRFDHHEAALARIERARAAQAATASGALTRVGIGAGGGAGDDGAGYGGGGGDEEGGDGGYGGGGYSYSGYDAGGAGGGSGGADEESSGGGFSNYGGGFSSYGGGGGGPMGAVDGGPSPLGPPDASGARGGAGGGAAEQRSDRGFGAAGDRFAAATGAGFGVPSSPGRERGGGGRDDDFGDADVGAMLKD